MTGSGMEALLIFGGFVLPFGVAYVVGVIVGVKIVMSKPRLSHDQLGVLVALVPVLHVVCGGGLLWLLGVLGVHWASWVGGVVLSLFGAAGGPWLVRKFARGEQPSRRKGE